MSNTNDVAEHSAGADGSAANPQVIRVSINGRKPIALEPEDAATLISELASALADGRDCLIEM